MRTLQWSKFMIPTLSATIDSGDDAATAQMTAQWVDHDHAWVPAPILRYRVRHNDIAYDVIVGLIPISGEQALFDEAYDSDGSRDLLLQATSDLLLSEGHRLARQLAAAAGHEFPTRSAVRDVEWLESVDSLLA